MTVFNSGLAQINIVDFARETQTHSFDGLELTAGNIVAQTAKFTAYIAALNAITLGNVYTTVFGNRMVNIPINPPNLETAHREKQWLVAFTDLINAKRYTLRIAAPTETNNMKTNSDHADLTATDIAAFVAAFESLALSPDQNTIKVNDMLVVGKNDRNPKVQY